MNETQLVVKKAIQGPGAIIDNGSGYVTSLVTPQAAFVAGDWTGYIGKYVHIFENYTPTDWGFHKITNAIYDGATWTELFTEEPWDFYSFPNQGSAAFEIHEAVTLFEDLYLDLYENETISQNWAFSDLGSFSIQSPFTRQFRLPNTINNKAIFEAIGNPNFSKIDNFFYYRLPARISVDSIPIINGYLKLNKVITQRDLITDFEVTFYGNTSDFARDVNQLKLADLDLSTYNPLANFANVNAAASGSFDYLFAFCDRGQNWNNAGGRSITDPIYAGDFTPCLRWDVLFDKIITGVGWTYEAPELMDTLAAYWMPFLNSRNIRYTVNLNAKFFFNAYLNTDITLTGNSASLFRPTIETSDPAGRYSAGANSSYSIPLSGEYSFSFWTTLTVIGNPAVNSTAIGTLQIYVDNITSGVSLLVTSFPINPNSGADLVFYISGNATGIIAQTNDVIKLRYSYVQVTGVIANNVRIESGSSIFGGSGWKLNQITTAFEGFQIDFAANAPDMRQIDFITDVVKMHNLAVIEHPTIEKRLIFKTLPDYIGSGPTYDWTQKLDLNKDVVTYSTIEQQKAELYYSYSAGADAASKAFQQAGRIYGDFKIDGYTVNPSINASEFITGKQEIKLITQSTPALNLGPTHVPKFIDVNGSFVIPGPRCLYYSHTINIPKMFNAGNYVAFNAPTLSHYSVENPTIADFDLNWSPEVPLHNITTNPYFTLFNLYWRDYLNEIYSPDARIMEAYFQLEISDITPIDFSALIFIKDSYWRIIDVSEYKYGSQESTKVKLLKIVTPLLDCDVLPSSMDANGIIIFKDVNGDPASPTASCCVRYGYEWDPLNEVCYGLVSPDELLGNITIANTFNTALTRETKSATRSVVGTNNTVSDSNLNVIVSGNKVDIVDGNSNLLAIGDTLKLDTAVSGNTMIGKNVLTSSSGFHLGGGWKNNDKAQADGSTQYGIIMHGNKDAIAFSGQIITPPIENIAGNFLIIPNESYWMALVSITIFEELTGENYTALYHCNLWKTTGVSVGSIPILISEDNLFGGGITFGLTIDTSADPTQHRFDITVSGAGFPRTLKTTLAVQYTAVR